MKDAAPSRRIPALDITRGIALLAMVLYHTGWDLSVLGLAGVGLRGNPAWQVFGHLIAASFLLLAGVSLFLAQGAQLDRAAFLKRLAMLVGAAALVTGVTWYIFPQQVIVFGILHAIALGSVLALPFLRAPLALVVLVAGLAFVLPTVAKSEALSSPWLVWLGLASHVPPSQDFVPVFPWFGFMLAGIVLGRVVDFTRFAAPPPVRHPARLLNLAGRHSLAIYLLHQPLIYGSLWLVAQAAVPPAERDMREFMTSCTSECTTNGGVPLACNRICACAAEALQSEKLWHDVMVGRITPALQERFGAISRSCALKVKGNP